MQEVLGSNPRWSKFLFPKKLISKSISLEKETCCTWDWNPGPPAWQVGMLTITPEQIIHNLRRYLLIEFQSKSILGISTELNYVNIVQN